MDDKGLKRLAKFLFPNFARKLLIARNFHWSTGIAAADRVNMDSSRSTIAPAQSSSTENDEVAIARRRTTTIRLLDYLTSFAENTDPGARGTEEDPHMGFVAAIQASYQEQTRQLELEARGRKGVSISALLSGIKSETSSSQITTNDLARLITRGSEESKNGVLQQTIAKRRDLLDRSRRLSVQAVELSGNGRSVFIEGRIEEAKEIFKKADELFREAVLLLRTEDETH